MTETHLDVNIELIFFRDVYNSFGNDILKKQS